MAVVEVNVKIISSPIQKIIGWKGDVLEIGLNTGELDSHVDILKEYLSRSLNMDKALIEIEEDSKIFKVRITGKYIEDPRILFSDIA